MTSDSAPQWFLYVLECSGGRLYTGVSVNVEARFKAHLSGRGAKFTRSFPPNRILLIEPHASRSAALKAEHAMKKLPAARKRDIVKQAKRPRKTRA